MSTRPSVPRPTGTEIGSPRSSAFMPRTSPSVGFIATQRTRPSPRCCSTSAMISSGSGMSNPSLDDAHRVVNQRQVALFKLHVHHRANDFCHVADFVLVRCHSEFLLSLPNVLRLRGGRAAYDFDQFLRDARLANLVHVERERCRSGPRRSAWRNPSPSCARRAPPPPIPAECGRLPLPDSAARGR